MFIKKNFTQIQIVVSSIDSGIQYQQQQEQLIQQSTHKSELPIILKKRNVSSKNTTKLGKYFINYIIIVFPH